MDFNNNVILGNDISGNSQDLEDAATSGPTGINVYRLAERNHHCPDVIHEEANVVVKVPSPGSVPAVQVHLNSFPGHRVGVQDLGTALVDATAHWWGCAGGSAANGCSTVLGPGMVLYQPWLTRPEQTQ